LTAADVDGYLMQGVWVFASAAARDAAVTAPSEGNFAYLKDTNVTTYYTGSAWANLDTTGMTNPMTTTGDTIYSSSGSTPARLGIGTSGQVLTVSGGGIPSWTTLASGSGLTKIGTYTLSAVTSQTMDSIFSSTYDNYYVLINVKTTLEDGIRMTLRASGSDTTSGYSNQQSGATGTTQFAARLTTGEIGAGGVNEMTSIALTITAPNLAKETQAIAANIQKNSAGAVELNYVINQSATTQFDGLKINVQTGNMTGTITVYGYAK
jgi:hypothetical protein